MCLCLSGCSSSNKIPTGYDPTYWGMGKSDVLKVISYVEHYDETETEILFKDARVLNMRDYNLLSLETFNPFDGGYQIPEVTYIFEDDALCEIEVKYIYKSQQDIEWYGDMVKWLENKYTKSYVSDMTDDDIMMYGATSFDLNENTEIMLMTFEMKTIIDDYGSLTISYKKN